MSHTALPRSVVDSARKVVAADLLQRREAQPHEDPQGEPIVSIGAWVTVRGVDVWVQACHGDHLESDTFVDDSICKEG